MQIGAKAQNSINLDQGWKSNQYQGKAGLNIWRSLNIRLRQEHKHNKHQVKEVPSQKWEMVNTWPR